MKNIEITALSIRPAAESDAALILTFIRELAAFEKLEDQITADEESICVSIFEKKQAEVIIGEFGGKAAAFALYFHNYSTFLGRANLYLEDLFVREDFRGKGIGKAMLHRLAKIAVAQGCGRLDWACLDWNRPAIGFYRKLGAQVIDDRRIFRFGGDVLLSFAGSESL